MTAAVNGGEKHLEIPGLAGEKHFTLQQLEELWELSRITLTDWFREEPGVLKVGAPYKRGRQGRMTLRIPASVAARVHERHCGGGR